MARTGGVGTCVLEGPQSDQAAAESLVLLRQRELQDDPKGFRDHRALTWLGVWSLEVCVCVRVIMALQFGDVQRL